MALKMQQTVIDFLQSNPGKKYTAREIATWIIENYPEECREKRERSTMTFDTDSAFISQLGAEIGVARSGMQKKHDEIKVTEGRPRKYYFTELTDSDEVDHAEGNSSPLVPTKKESVISEHQLYPLLAEYLMSGFNIFSKRIDEKRSRNTKGAGGNEWLYPDLVGMEDLSSDWHREIKNSVQLHADKRAKLWSFEVKRLVNRSNVRRAFFQTVSNSSWANYGYLVASEYVDVEKELRILASLHGIGFIQLDIENPAESTVIIPAKERSEIDWDTMNRIAKENSDFLDYITLICEFYQTGRTRPSLWPLTESSLALESS